MLDYQLIAGLKADLRAAAGDGEMLRELIEESYRKVLADQTILAGGDLNASSQILSGKLNVKLRSNKAHERERIFAAMKLARLNWAGIDRAGVLRKFADSLMSSEVQEYLAFTLMLELGKDEASAKSELVKTVEYLNYYLSDGFMHMLQPSWENKITTERRARGVVGIITSANYPIALSMPAIIAGLLAGNPIIIKPTTKAMLWVFVVKELFVAAGGDADLFQIVIGYEMDFYKQVDSLFFVGSEETGKKIRKERFEYRLEHNLLENGTDIFELGGISPAVVMKSWQGDVRELAKVIFAGVTGNSGQRCTATKVLVLERGVDGVLDEVVKLFAEFDTRQVNNPFVDGAKYGAIFDADVLVKIEAAKKLGLKVVGGEVVGRAGGGRYVTPMLVLATGADERVMEFIFKCEIFGPVVFVFNNVDDVIALCNRIDQPLSSGVFCDEADFVKFREGTNFGSVNHNRTAKDLSPYGSHGARFRSGGSTNDAMSMVNAVTFAVSYTS